MEILRRFDKVETLKIDAQDEANFTNILKIINEDSSFPWFKTVTTCKCYEARAMTDMKELQTFFTKLENLTDFRGIWQTYFDPLAKFKELDKRVERLNTTIPSEADVRKQFFAFLEHNKTKRLRIKCGPETNSVWESLYLDGNTEELFLECCVNTDFSAVF